MGPLVHGPALGEANDPSSEWILENQSFRGVFSPNLSKTSGGTTELSEIAGVSRMARPQRGTHRFTDEPVPAIPTKLGKTSRPAVR